MPMDPWEAMKGEVCAVCEEPASHFWCGTPSCCQCHGGHIFSKEETAHFHELMNQGINPSQPEFTAKMGGFYAEDSS